VENRMGDCQPEGAEIVTMSKKDDTQGDRGERKQEIINAEKQVFYTTADDSSGANLLRKLRCGCLDPEYEFTTEKIGISEWHTCDKEGCCSRKTDSVDIDEIQDLALYNTCGLGYCLFDRGHFIIWVREKGESTSTMRHIYHIENSTTIFDEYSKYVAKINNLVMGMARFSGDTPELMYDSRDDGQLVKFCRSILCCGCCCFPRTTISKRLVTQAAWGCYMPKGIWLGELFACYQKHTTMLDTDNIKDVELQRSCADMMCLGTGTMLIDAPADKDTPNLKVKFVGNGKNVYKTFDEFVNKLDNRERVIGQSGMGR